MKLFKKNNRKSGNMWKKKKWIHDKQWNQMRSENVTKNSSSAKVIWCHIVSHQMPIQTIRKNTLLWKHLICVRLHPSGKC